MNDIRQDPHEAHLADILHAEAIRRDPPVFDAAAISGPYTLRRARRTRATLAIAAVLAFAAVTGTIITLVPHGGGPGTGPVGPQPTLTPGPTAATSATSTPPSPTTPGGSAPISATGSTTAAADAARDYLASAEADHQQLCGTTFDGALFDSSDWPITVTLFSGSSTDTQQEAVLTQAPDGTVSAHCRAFDGPKTRFTDQASTLGAAVKAVQQSRPLPKGLPTNLLCPTPANPHPTAWVAWDSAAGTVVYGYKVTDDPAAAHTFQVSWSSVTGTVTSACP
jgi:hypothetical protein